MEIIQPIADLLGTTPEVVIGGTVLLLIGIIGLYVVKIVVKTTWKLFVTGVTVLLFLAACIGAAMIAINVTNGGL